MTFQIANFQSPNVGFAGDWHGTVRWAVKALKVLDAWGVKFVYHLGDFGVWPDTTVEKWGTNYRRSINGLLYKYGMQMVVILGNHEWYDKVEEWPLNEFGFIVEPEHPYIWYATRGQVWQHNDAWVAGLGGAFSIDKDFRAEGLEWWPQEAITVENVETLRANMEAAGIDKVDLFLSHDHPAGLNHGKEFDLDPHLANESARQRVILRDAVDYARPFNLVHGHWHKKLINRYEGAGFDYKPYYCVAYGLTNEYNQIGNIMTAELVPYVGLTDVEFPVIA